MTFGPDGRRLAAAGFEGSASVWDTVTGGQLLKLAHGSQIADVAFSPDGARLATAGEDGTARVWDAGTGDQLMEVRHDPWVNGLAFSPDGARLATAGEDGIARLWDARTGDQLLEIERRSLGEEDDGLLDSAVTGVAFSPDGRRLATSSNDGTTRVWNAVTGAPLLEVQGDSPIAAVAFSPRGGCFATASEDGIAQLWDALTGDELLRVRHRRLPWNRTLESVAFSPDGERLATAGWDKTARIWDRATGEELLRIRHSDWVTGVAFSPDGQCIATAAGAARNWDVGGSPSPSEGQSPRLLGRAWTWSSLKSLAVAVALTLLGLTIAWFVFGAEVTAEDKLWGIGGAVSIGVGLLLVHPVEEYEWGPGLILLGALAMALPFVPK